MCARACVHARAHTHTHRHFSESFLKKKKNKKQIKKKKNKTRTFLRTMPQWKENRPSILRPKFAKNLELGFLFCFVLFCLTLPERLLENSLAHSDTRAHPHHTHA